MNNLNFTESDATAYIIEFFERKTLAGLGFKFDGEKLDDFSAQVFCFIDNELNKLYLEKTKKI